MKELKLISLLIICLVVIMALSLPAFAKDGNNVADYAGDLLTGKLESVEFWPYAAYTTKGVTRLMGIPVIPKNLRTKFSTRLHQDPAEDTIYKLEMGIEF